MNLPPLPEPDALVEECEAFDSQPARKYASFTEEQLRAYAEAAVLAERERCARVCEQVSNELFAEGFTWGCNGASSCAAAIRALE